MGESRAAVPALMLASNSRPSASATVIGTLREEHRTLRTVLSIVDRVLADVAHFGIDPDFKLICAALYYIDEFPERVHHPKEDEFIFPALRRRTPRFDATLDRLRADHMRSPHMLRKLERELVHYQGGAPDGLRRMRAALAAYADFLLVHMRTEEELLDAALAHLTEDDWSAIGRVLATNEDPLGAGAHGLEFKRLRARILSLLPRRLRVHAAEGVPLRAERTTADEASPT